MRIYQINGKRDIERLQFLSYGYLEQIAKELGRDVVVDRSIYDLVWQDDMGDMSLEEIYYAFNRDNRPNKFSRSLSVSDVVEIMHNEDPAKNGFWFCDSFGWKKLDKF